MGTFDGLREVLSISDRALTDSSSALKEVSAANRVDGAILEKVLEANLKYRRDVLTEVHNKLNRVTGEGQTYIQSAESKDKGKYEDNKEVYMQDFFKEVSMARKKEMPK